MEINAHSLVIWYRELRDTSKLHLFQYLDILGSQSCEELYRHMRSVNNINMTMYESLGKLKRINFLTEIEQRLLEEGNTHFSIG